MMTRPVTEARVKGNRWALKARWNSWWQAKNPVLKFVVLFGGLLAVFYGLTLLPIFKHRVFPGYLSFNARAASSILNLMGCRSTVMDNAIRSPQVSLDVRRGCDAVEPTALFLAAVLAFPAAFRRKVPGMIAGAAILAAVNLVRIISLFWIGAHYPKLFDVMHTEVWQAAFILLALVLWAGWIRWAMRPRPAAANVAR